VKASLAPARLTREIDRFAKRKSVSVVAFRDGDEIAREEWTSATSSVDVAHALVALVEEHAIAFHRGDETKPEYAVKVLVEDSPRVRWETAIDLDWVRIGLPMNASALRSEIAILRSRVAELEREIAMMRGCDNDVTIAG
jgi:hypothetical protein